MMTGMFAGYLSKDSERTPLHKCRTLVIIGLKVYVGDFYPALIVIANAVIIYQILRVMYRQQVFLKV